MEMGTSLPPASAATVGTWNPETIHSVSFSILAFLTFALIIGGLLLWKNNSDATQVTKILVVISIVGVSAVLLVAGYSNEQLTPITGLFGAIVGYVLGKDSPPK